MSLITRVCSMAMVSLVVLVMQNSALVVMTRFSRKNIAPESNYYTSTLVLNQECVKMLMCLVIYAFDDVRKQLQRDAAAVAAEVELDAVEIVVTTDEMDRAKEDVAVALPSVTAYATPEDGTPTIAPDIASSGNDSPGYTEDLKRSRTPAAETEGEEGGLRSGGEAASAFHGVAHSFNGATGAALAVAPAASVVTAKRRFARAPPPPQTTDGARATERVGDARRLAPARGLRLRLRPITAAVRLYCSMLRTAVWRRDTFKLLVPAVLFNLQNFLIFLGLSNLDAVSFQVWSQTKLLSTAVFSVWLLHRRLSALQWVSLAVLTAGVLGAQFGTTKPTSIASVTQPPATKLAHKRFVQYLANPQQQQQGANTGTEDEPHTRAMIGIASCLISGLSSSYAGVYFERVVKTTSPTLSIRNIQLSLFGIPLAFLSMLALDVFPRWHAQYGCGLPIHWNIFVAPSEREKVVLVAGMTKGVMGCPVPPFYYWQRYNQWLTWGLVCIHALGGLLVAVVVKYADNILKGFATGVAVIVSGVMSSVIWGYQPSAAFVLGAFLVIGSSIAFHKFESKTVR